MAHEQGECPQCCRVGFLKYESVKDSYDGIAYSVTCPDCGFCGLEQYNILFAGFLTENGEEVF